MDLPPPPPPPPPPPRFRHHHNHLRYENVLRPPDFFPPPPYSHHHLPPPPVPPQPHPSTILLPPPPPPPLPRPPPPPMRRMSPPPLPRFAFSPPPCPIIHRSHLYEFEPPPKPYFRPTLPPPPLPPPPRENIPFRIVHDYPERYPVFEDEVFPRGRIDNIRELPENRDRNWHWGSNEVHVRVPGIDVGGPDRYCNVSSESFELHRRDDGGRCDSGIRDWGSELDSRRDYDERRWNNDMNGRNRELFREHDNDERRWSNGMNDRSHDLYWEGYFDERRWDSGVNSYELHCRADDDEKRWESSRSAGLLSRLGNRQTVFAEDNLSLGGVLSRLGNRQLEFPEDNSSLGGVMSRLGNRQLELADDDPCSGGVLSRLGDRQPDFAAVDPSLSGVLSRLGNRLPEFAENDLSLSGVLSRLGNKQPEFGENDLSLGRFSGRLGSGATSGEFNRPNKKKKSQKKNTLHRIQLGNIHSRPSVSLTSHLLADESSRGYFKIKEKGSGKMQTRREDKKEREQSPVELAISFKSNSLVAKAIPVPSYPAVESCVESKPVTKGLGCNVSAFPEAKKDVISDLQSDSHGTSKDHLDEAADYGDVNVTANSVRDLGESILKNAHPKVLNLQGPSVVKSGETHSSWFRKRKRSTEQLLLESNLQLEKDSHDISIDAGKHSVPRLKRERSSMNTTSTSSYVDDNVITNCSSRAEGLVTTTEDAGRVRQLIADEVIRHAHDNFLPIGNTGHGDSMGFNQNDNIVKKYVHVRGDGVNEISIVGEKVQLESSTSFIQRSSEDIVLIKDLDIAGLSRPQDIKISDIEDNYFPEIHELVSSLKPDCAIMQISENTIVSDVGSKDANSEDLSPNQAITSQVMLDAKDLRSLEGDAVTDCSNVAFDISTSSCIRNIDFIEGSPEVKSDKTCLSVDNSFPKVISDRETCLTLDRSSKVVRKRKTRGAQTGLSCTKTNLSAGIVGSIDDEVTRHMAKDIFPAVDVDVAGTKDCSKKDTSIKEGSSGRDDSLLELHGNANGSVSGYRKKQKFSSIRPSASSLFLDTIAADLLSTRPSKCGAKQSEDNSSASTTITEFETTDEGGEVGINDLYVVNVVDDNVTQGNRDLSLIASGISYPDRDGLSPSNSGDEPLASAFDIQTSLEELHVKSPLIFPGNTKASACLSDIEMIYQSDTESNKEPLIAGKYLEEALNKSHTNADIPLPLQKDTSQVVKKLYPLHGKLTWSKNQLPSAINKVFSAQHPLSFSNTRKLYPSHATKSRTWCRTGNSTVPVAERNVQPYPVPQDNLINAAKSVQSSYIRKGNSLVRKPSSSDDTAPGFHGSSCSGYRLDRCATITKNNMATNNKIGDADAPTLKRTGQISTSEMTKSPTRSHSGNSLSCTPCNLEEPLPVKNPQSNDFPSKTSDVMEERIKSSPVTECQTDSVTTSDSQSTAGGGNSEKNVIYVKRRSYQLVATTNSNDESIIKVGNDQPQLSDGYYKSRGNQLVRASSENHLTRGNGNSDVSRLVPHLLTSKTSTRRQSGLSKSCRHSKFSFVWKLLDTQSSEKHKNCLGPRRPYLFSHKRASYSKNLRLGIKLPLSNISQKLLVSRKRGAIYTRSSRGYSLRMSKVLSVGSSSLKWSKSIERNSKKANEEATRAVAAAEKRKKEEKGAVSIASKSRNHVSRKWVLSVKSRPERIFRIGSERYKMDATRRTLHRITEKESSSSSSVALQSEKNIKRSYIPRRLLIGNEEYVRIGNGNQLVRDPKRRTRVLASEKVRWSLRTARLRLARKRKYCQFFTRFGKCNKDDGKCLYIHDPSKIVVCTKYLTGSCTNINCKLTHKVIPERMQDCSYFLKGSCSNENCPYRHVHVNPDSTVCESFLRGYCADGNECRKKHTYVCPAFEVTGACAQMSTCKLHHPKKKTEKKPASEQRIVRGRYFDGGLIEDTDSDSPPTEKLSSKGNGDTVFHEGEFPDYISLDVSDDKDEIMPEVVIEDVGEVR